MAEVLSKEKKYINGEETLISKRGSSSAQKEKSKEEKKWERSPEDEETETDLHGGTEKTKINLQREEVTLGTTWVHLSPSCSRGTHLNSSPPPDGLGVSSPIQGAA